MKVRPWKVRIPFIQTQEVERFPLARVVTLRVYGKEVVVRLNDFTHVFEMKEWVALESRK